MLEYSFYTDTYFGTVITSSSIWNRLIRKATAYFNKLDTNYTLVYTEDGKNSALCAMCEVMLNYEDLKDKSSESDGSYSVTFNKDKTTDLNKNIMEEISIYIDIYRGQGVVYDDL